MSSNIWPAGTRIRMPLEVGRDDDRLASPASSAACRCRTRRRGSRGCPWRPSPRGCRRRARRPRPSCACGAVLNANGTCWISATGTTAPSTPPISVKNWISPATSIFSAAGSLPATLLLSGKTCASTRPPVSLLTAAHISDEPLVQRALRGLVVVLGETELGLRALREHRQRANEQRCRADRRARQERTSRQSVSSSSCRPGRSAARPNRRPPAGTEPYGYQLPPSSATRPGLACRPSSPGSRPCAARASARRRCRPRPCRSCRPDRR